MRTHGPGRVLIGALLALAVVAGCSDDGGDADDDPSGPGTGLEADFSYQVDLDATGGTSCPAVGVTFTDESRGDPTGWEWEFGDGSTSAEQDPVRTVGPENGEEVTLTVTRGDESDSTTQEIDFAVC